MLCLSLMSWNSLASTMQKNVGSSCPRSSAGTEHILPFLEPSWVCPSQCAAESVTSLAPSECYVGGIFFAAFYFLCLVINSGHETRSATTEYSECRLVLSYWEIGPLLLVFAGWMDVSVRNSVQILPIWLCGFPRSRFCSCLCSPILGGGKETAH